MLGEGGLFLSWGRLSDSPAGLELTMEPRWTDLNLLQTSQVVSEVTGMSTDPVCAVGELTRNSSRLGKHS